MKNQITREQFERDKRQQATLSFCAGVTGLKPGGLRRMVEALQNMVGAFDSPISRRRIAEPLAVEARKTARDALDGLKLESSAKVED